VFHTQGTTSHSISVASFTAPPVVEKTSLASCTSNAVNKAKRFGKTKSFTKWKAKVHFGQSQRYQKHPMNQGFVTINTGLMVSGSVGLARNPFVVERFPAQFKPTANRPKEILRSKPAQRCSS